MRQSLKEKYQFNRTITPHTLRLQNFKLGGKYLIFDLIASGKNSAIYYGIQEKTKLERVFKFYNLKEIEDSKGFKQKENCKRISNYETRIINKCNSMNIWKCLDIFQDRNYKILVYQYCQSTLQQQIDNRVESTISETRAILILKQILSALKDLNYNANLIHANLKADKILVFNGIYKLIDFGLPLLQDESQYFNLGQFLVPQIISRKGFNQKAQVWSIGVLFHHILFGKLPEKLNKQNIKFLQQHSDQSIYFPDYKDSNTSQQVSQFLKDCLFIDPELRMSLKEIDKHPMFSLLYTNTDSVHQDLEKQTISLTQNQYSQNEERVLETKRSNTLSIVLNIDIKQRGQKLTSFCQQTFHFGMLRREVLKELQKKYERLGHSFQITQIEKTSISQLKSQINRQQTILYQQYKKYYLECLKVDFIFENIIKPLQAHKNCRQQRYEVQLIYMILSTCFAAMSRLNQINKKQSQRTEYLKLLQQCVRKSTQILYQNVEHGQRQYGQLLTEIENKVSSIISDRFSKIFSSKIINQKDLYLGGIQNCDFTKQQKIEFTYRFFTENLNKMETARQNQLSIKKVRALKYLKNYVKIWQIQNEQQIQEKYTSLKTYIDKQILHIQQRIDSSNIISQILI